MINLCLSNEEKSVLRELIGKKLIKIRHDPFDKFDEESVYGRVELFFNETIVLINYDYAPYHLFGIENDEHPKFSIKIIKEDEAISSLVGVKQIDVALDKKIKDILLVEENLTLEWNDKIETINSLQAIIIDFGVMKYVFQGDYMLPLIDIFKTENFEDLLHEPGYEFSGIKDIKFEANRRIISLLKSQ